MDKKTDTSTSQIEVQPRHAHCLGCGEILRYASLLICLECLNDECGQFADLTKTDLE